MMLVLVLVIFPYLLGNMPNAHDRRDSSDFDSIFWLWLCHKSPTLSKVKSVLSFSWQSLQKLNLRESEQHIEKEDSERVECRNSLQRTSDEVAKREKLIVELTGKANSLEEIKNKAIVEAKQLRKQLENLEKEKTAKEKKMVPKEKALPI